MERTCVRGVCEGKWGNIKRRLTELKNTRTHTHKNRKVKKVGKKKCVGISVKRRKTKWKEQTDSPTD